MAVYCKQGTAMKLPDSSGNCPAGYTKVDTGTAAAGGGGGQSLPNTPPAGGGRQSPDGDYNVWYPRLPGTYDVKNVQPGGYGLQDFLNSPSTSSFAPSEYQSKSYAESQVGMLPIDDQMTLLAIAKSRGGRSMGPAWDMFVQQASAYGQAGKKVTPIELMRSYAASAGIGPGGAGSGGSGAAGPKPIDELGIRRAMDSVSTSLIGRTLSDKEFKQYYKSYTGAFGGDPGMDYQQHEVEAIKKEEDYQEMQVAQKFSKAFDSVLKGAM